MVELLAARKIDERPLLRQAGLSHIDLTNSDLSVPAAAEAFLIELAAQAAGDPGFGIRMAEGLNPRETGMLYYLFNAAPTLQRALTLLCRYVRIANASVNWTASFSPTADAVAELNYVGLLRRELKCASEYHLAAVVKVLRAIAGRAVSPTRVNFAHFRCDASREAERFFSCPVEFGTPTDRLFFSRETLEIPVVYADPKLLEILRPYCDRAAALHAPSSASFRVTVENEIQKYLSSGRAQIDAIAGGIGVSSRSLERRLAEEGTTFSEVLDNLRRTLAIQYLAEPSLSVDRITGLLGYGVAGSFSHAFRRWTGASPSQVRSDPARLSRAKCETDSLTETGVFPEELAHQPL